jgi:hypothetical protein
VTKDRLRHGKWVAAEGLIYEDWSAGIHLLDCMPTFSDNTPVDQAGVPWAWPRYWSIDFGFTNPFVCQFWAEDPDGRLYLYREHYLTERTVSTHAKLILDMVAPEVEVEGGGKGKREWLEPRPQAVVCDHDAENRAQFSYEIELATQNAHKAVTEGIQAVQERLKVRADGKPRLFILRSALTRRDLALEEAKKPTCTAEEITSYVWSDRVGKEAPVKENDHGCDAMRYVVAHRDLSIKSSFRWLT